MRTSTSRTSLDTCDARLGGAAGALLSNDLIASIGLRALELRTLLLIGP